MAEGRAWKEINVKYRYREAKGREGKQGREANDVGEDGD